LIEIQQLGRDKPLLEIGQLGNSGYVVDSVPLAITAASRVTKIGIDEMHKELIEIGGDTDTNCSIAGQVTGALLGLLGNRNIPQQLVHKLQNLSEYAWISDVLSRIMNRESWT